MSKGVYRFIVVYYIFFTSFPLYINSRFKRIVSIKKKILKKNKSDLFLSFHHSYIDYCNNNYYYYYYCIIIKHERLRRFQSSSYILNHSSLSRCVWGGDWSSSTCKFIVLDCDIFVCFFFFSFFLYICVLKTDQSPIIRGWLFLLSFLRQRRFKVLFENFNLASVISKRSNYYFRFYRDVALRFDCIYTYTIFLSFFFFFCLLFFVTLPPPKKMQEYCIVNSIIIRSFFFFRQ